MSIFRRRIIQAQPEEFIEFEDEAVKTICVANFGGANGITNKNYGTLGVKGKDGEITLAQAKAVTNIATLFSGKTTIEYFRELKYFENVTVLNDGAFKGCTNLKDIDVTNIKEMYKSCLGNCTSLWKGEDVVLPKLEKMTGGYCYAVGCFTNVPMKSFTAKNCTLVDVQNAFSGCKSLESVELAPDCTFQYTGLVSFGMFLNCSSLKKTSISAKNHFNKVLASIFCGCTSLTTADFEAMDIGNWDMSSVTSLDAFFSGCAGLTTLDLNSWDTSSNTGISSMFANCSNLTSLQIGEWKTSKLANMREAFSGCSNLTVLDIGGWDTSSLSNLWGTFKNCKKITSLHFDKWKVSKVQYLNDICSGMNQLTDVVLGDGNMPNLVNIQGAFASCWNIKTVDVSKWGVGNVSSFGYAFRDCSSLTALDTSGWTPNNINSIEYAFCNCRSLTSIDVSKWNMSKVKGINMAFSGCSSLTEIAFGSDTTMPLVTNAYAAFNCCSKLKRVVLPKGAMNSLVYIHAMFSACTALETVENFDTWSSSALCYIGSAFSGCKALQSISCPNLIPSNNSSLGSASAFITGTTVDYIDLSGWDTSSVKGDVWGSLLTNNAFNSLYLGENFFAMKIKCTVSLVSSTWTDESVQESLVNTSYDRASAGLPTVTIKVHANTKAVLSDDDIATLESKGYAITT